MRNILSDKNNPAYPAMYEFMLHLALNHDVQPERPDGPGTERVVYSASSPDEGAFVNCANRTLLLLRPEFLDASLSPSGISRTHCYCCCCL